MAVDRAAVEDLHDEFDVVRREEPEHARVRRARDAAGGAALVAGPPVRAHLVATVLQAERGLVPCAARRRRRASRRGSFHPRSAADHVPAPGRVGAGGAGGERGNVGDRAEAIADGAGPASFDVRGRHAGERTAGPEVPHRHRYRNVGQAGREDPPVAVDRAAVEDLHDQLDVRRLEEPEVAAAGRQALCHPSTPSSLAVLPCHLDLEPAQAKEVVLRAAGRLGRPGRRRDLRCTFRRQRTVAGLDCEAIRDVRHQFGHDRRRAVPRRRPDQAQLRIARPLLEDRELRLRARVVAPAQFDLRLAQRPGGKFRGRRRGAERRRGPGTVVVRVRVHGVARNRAAVRHQVLAAPVESDLDREVHGLARFHAAQAAGRQAIRIFFAATGRDFEVASRLQRARDSHVPRIVRSGVADADVVVDEPLRDDAAFRTQAQIRLGNGRRFGAARIVRIVRVARIARA